MNKVLYLFLLSALIFSCSNSQSSFELSDSKPNSNQNSGTEDINQHLLDGIEYSCYIEVIDNKMTSTYPNDDLYAIVSLRPESGKLQNNWRIKTFNIEGNEYSKYDDYSLKSKDQPIYRNNIREIPKEFSSPFTAKVEFENDKGEVLNFVLDGLRAAEVH